jgi:hypothetical protein
MVVERKKGEGGEEEVQDKSMDPIELFFDNAMKSALAPASPILFAVVFFK